MCVCVCFGCVWVTHVQFFFFVAQTKNNCWFVCICGVCLLFFFDCVFVNIGRGGRRYNNNRGFGNQSQGYHHRDRDRDRDNRHNDRWYDNNNNDNSGSYSRYP